MSEQQGQRIFRPELKLGKYHYLALRGYKIHEKECVPVKWKLGKVRHS